MICAGAAPKGSRCRFDEAIAEGHSASGGPGRKDFGRKDFGRRGLRQPRAAAFTVVWSLLLSLALLAPAAAQEVVFGGEARIEPSAIASNRIAGTIEPFLGLSFLPNLSVYGDIAELSATALFALRFGDAVVSDDPFPELDPIDPDTAVDLTELKLRLYPTDWSVVDLGYFATAPGKALLVSPNNYFSPVSIETLLIGGSGAPAPLLSARAFFGSAFASLAVAPSPRTPTLPEVDSVWFPSLPIPTTIDNPELSSQVVALDTVSAEPTKRIADGFRRISGSAELGATLQSTDLSLFYYHGIDRIPVPRARISLLNETTDTTYDLIIQPEESLIDSIGFAAEGVIGPVALWLDAAFAFNKRFGTTQIAPITKRTITVDGVPVLTAVAGARLGPIAPDIMVAAEYRHSFAFSDRDDLVRLDLPSLAFATARFGLLDGKIALAAAGVVSPGDWSSALLASVELAPQGVVSAALRVPLFLGGEGSLFGQYRDVYAVNAQVLFRF